MKTVRIFPIFWIMGLLLVVCGSAFAVGSISGTVYYRGPKDGNIYVNAYDNQQYQGPPAYQTVINDTGPYIIPNMANGYYWLRAFMDADSNYHYDPVQDPDGFPYIGNPILIQNNSVTGIDILLDYAGILMPEDIDIIKLSPSMQSAWIGTENYLVWSSAYADHVWGPEYIDSVWTYSVGIEGWGGKMYDDGLHWDGEFCDGIFGRYELNDSAALHIWMGQGQYWDQEMGVVFAPWPLGGLGVQLDMAPLSSSLPIPILIEPAFGDTVDVLQPQYIWHCNSGDRYEIIVWDTIPMPDNLGENIVWRQEVIGSNDTTLSMVGDTVQLEHGQSYYWALISYADSCIYPSLLTDAMEWAQFYVDTNYAGVNEEAITTISQPVIQLFQNYPNPFCKTTHIKFQILPAHSREFTQSGTSTNPPRCLADQTNPNIQPSIKIYDVAGRLVKPFNHLANQPFKHIIWDGTGDDGKKVASGIYFYKLKTPGFSQIRKMIFMKP